MSENGAKATKSLLPRREEKVLKHFKQVLKDLLVVLRVSASSDTAYMHWVNRKREQFVLETGSTDRTDVYFQDRVQFEDHFLHDFKDLKQPSVVELNEAFPAESLIHHTSEFTGKGVLLLPLMNNGETVAITGVELNDAIEISDELSTAATSYISALENILRTYFELSGMLEEETTWSSFDEDLSELADQKTYLKLIQKGIDIIGRQLKSGGVAFLARTMDAWHVILSKSVRSKKLPIGLLMSENSQAGLCLKSLSAEFSLHFNGNPKRISAKEGYFEGASTAIPVSTKKIRQGVFVVWDENPLVFKESLNHKLKSIGLTCSLALDNLVPQSIDEIRDIFSESNKTCKLEILESIIDDEINLRSNGDLPSSTFLTFVTPADYQELRAKVRLDDIRKLQEAMSVDLNPNHSGVPGLVGLHTECIFMVLMVNATEQQVVNWTQDFTTFVSKQDDGIYPEGIEFHFGIVELKNEHEDSYHFIQDAKKALNQAVKQKLEIVI